MSESSSGSTRRFSILCRWCRTLVDPVVAPIHPSCDVEREQWQAEGYPYESRFPQVYRELRRQN
jgi:hypothetical protein